MRLRDSFAVTTAAGQGIGRAVAEAFSNAGARVLATDINSETLSTLTTCETRILDVTDANAINALVEDVGTPDILFNCAGFVHHGTILDCDEKNWQFSFDLNVTSMYRMMRAFLPGMVARRYGSIINMSSVASSIKGASDRFAYGATKASVIGMTKSVAADYVTSGIRCNAICPGTVDTPSWHERVAASDDPDAAREAFVARQPMGRIGTPEEIAALAVYLASNESAFTTGTVQIIDGGWSI